VTNLVMEFAIEMYDEIDHRRYHSITMRATTFGVHTVAAWLFSRGDMQYSS